MDFDNILNNLIQDNPFGDKGYTKEEDTRFWKLSRDENNVGAAIIRFLPDPEGVPFVRMQKIAANKGKGQYFVDEWSPATIGMRDPFQEKFSELWKKGEKEKAKQLGRKFRYITNIKVIKDPANPENEGKIFLFDMSQTLMDKIKGAMVLTESQIALGETPIQVYNPIKGQNFIIKAKMGSNKIITYEDSKFTGKEEAIYSSAEEAEKDIKENAYKLSEFLQPEFFLSYEELKAKLTKFLDEDEQVPDETQTTETSPAVETIDTGLNLKADSKPETAKMTETKAPEAADDLDSLLAELD
jgi:hypothetical protein